MSQFVGQNWDNLMNSHNTMWDQQDKGQTELNDLFLSLKNLVLRKNSIHWHVQYLAKYVSENLVPFGLRI